MELDVTQLGIAQLHQVYGELTIQLEFLTQKANQVKGLIIQKANEMQRAQAEQMQKLNATPGLKAVPPLAGTCETNCCKNEDNALNGLGSEAS